jgi:hypothetical protein
MVGTIADEAANLSSIAGVVVLRHMDTKQQ